MADMLKDKVWAEVEAHTRICREAYYLKRLRCLMKRDAWHRMIDLRESFR